MPLGVCVLPFKREWNVYGKYVIWENLLSRISLHDIQTGRGERESGTK
jgi:hypothetical protein